MNPGWFLGRFGVFRGQCLTWPFTVRKPNVFDRGRAAGSVVGQAVVGARPRSAKGDPREVAPGSLTLPSYYFRRRRYAAAARPVPSTTTARRSEARGVMALRTSGRYFMFVLPMQPHVETIRLRGNGGGRSAPLRRRCDHLIGCPVQALESGTVPWVIHRAAVLFDTPSSGA